jgi:DNA-binding GntR family transcriptional regulator
VELHRDIAQAIAARDVVGATNAVGAHYQYTQDRLFASEPSRASALRAGPDA